MHKTAAACSARYGISRSLRVLEAYPTVTRSPFRYCTRAPALTPFYLIVTFTCECIFKEACWSLGIECKGGMSVAAIGSQMLHLLGVPP